MCLFFVVVTHLVSRLPFHFVCTGAVQALCRRCAGAVAVMDEKFFSLVLVKQGKLDLGILNMLWKNDKFQEKKFIKLPNFLGSTFVKRLHSFGSLQYSSMV